MKLNIKFLSLLLLVACATPVKEGRAPASLDKIVDHEIYRDYFSHESYGKQVGFGMDFNLWTDLDKDYLKERADRSFKEALAKTFNPNMEGGMFGALKGNLINSFVENFVKTLYIYKIVDGTFQIDIHFSAKNDNPNNFSKEFDSNQLIVASDSLKEAILNSKMTTRPDLAVSQVTWPKKESPLQYTGGTISLWIKLLDLDIEFKKPIPTIANVVKGHFKFRRYFKVNPEYLSTIKHSGKDIKINGVRFVSENRKDSYITVDLYKTYNLKNIPPKYDRLEIAFNGLVAPQIHKKSFWHSLFPQKVEVSEKGKFVLEGELNPKFLSRGERFTTELNKLVYNFNDSSFTRKSEMETDVKDVADGPELIFEAENAEKDYEKRIAYQVKKSIQKDFAEKIISAFGINEFSEELR